MFETRLNNIQEFLDIEISSVFDLLRCYKLFFTQLSSSLYSLDS
ncbi:hypothetical protein J2W69_000230 [Rheinheimera soli]|uniref:Uncharacterized protein n=1 Tax=Rheinheimera soli TaxID=443616 RepID=A0ABU1VUC2_9GAMM|nr:hypothetical protein [Rheinheimera soli]